MLTTGSADSPGSGRRSILDSSTSVLESASKIVTADGNVITDAAPIAARSEVATFSAVKAPHATANGPLFALEAIEDAQREVEDNEGEKGHDAYEAPLSPSPVCMETSSSTPSPLPTLDASVTSLIESHVAEEPIEPISTTPPAFAPISTPTTTPFTADTTSVPSAASEFTWSEVKFKWEDEPVVPSSSTSSSASSSTTSSPSKPKRTFANPPKSNFFDDILTAPKPSSPGKNSVPTSPSSSERSTKAKFIKSQHLTAKKIAESPIMLTALYQILEPERAVMASPGNGRSASSTGEQNISATPAQASSTDSQESALSSLLSQPSSLGIARSATSGTPIGDATDSRSLYSSIHATKPASSMDSQEVAVKPDASHFETLMDKEVGSQSQRTRMSSSLDSIWATKPSDKEESDVFSSPPSTSDKSAEKLISPSSSPSNGTMSSMHAASNNTLTSKKKYKKRKGKNQLETTLYASMLPLEHPITPVLETVDEGSVLHATLPPIVASQPTDYSPQSLQSSAKDKKKASPEYDDPESSIEDRFNLPSKGTSASLWASTSDQSGSFAKSPFMETPSTRGGGQWVREGPDFDPNTEGAQPYAFFGTKKNIPRALADKMRKRA